jgi:hypothetical protein
MSIHDTGNLCSDLGSTACYQLPYCEATFSGSHEVVLLRRPLDAANGGLGTLVSTPVGRCRLTVSSNPC